jgi:hypothetical protein
MVFWLENLNGRDQLEDLGIGGEIILEWILGEIGWEGVDWIHVAQARDQWQVLVKALMNAQVP